MTKKRSSFVARSPAHDRRKTDQSPQRHIIKGPTVTTITPKRHETDRPLISNRHRANPPPIYPAPQTTHPSARSTNSLYNTARTRQPTCRPEPLDVSMATSMGVEAGSEMQDYELPYEEGDPTASPYITESNWHKSQRKMSHIGQHSIKHLRNRAASTYSLTGSSSVAQLEPWEKRFLSGREVFGDFCARTSAHGMPHIAESYTLAGKIFWVIVFTFCATAFCIQTYWTVAIYLSHKTNIEMQLLFEAAPFPAVTICNLNPYKVQIAEQYDEINQALLSYETEVTRSRPARTLDRRKRQVIYTPIYAKCLCANPLDGCVPLRESDEKERPDAQSCMCHQDVDRPENMWPCYPMSAWNRTKCAACRPTGICEYPTTIYQQAYPNRFRQTCFCQVVSNVCLRYESTDEPPWFDPWDVKSETVAFEPTSSTMSPEVLDALGAGDVEKQDLGSITTQAKENVISIVTAMPYDVRMNLSHNRDDFIRRCSFNGIDCNKTTQFRIHLDPEYGTCFTFNWNFTAEVKNSRAGPMYGLRLLLDVDQASYLPYTEAAGVRIVIHDQHDEPFPDSFGYSAPVGFVSSFGLKTKIMERMGPPFGNCTPKFRIDDYIYDEEYSTEGCYRNCFQHKIIEKCGCGDPRFPVPPNKNTCYLYDREQRNCLAALQKEIGSFQRIRDTCTCRQPCTETAFETAYAAAAWPANNFMTGDCPEWVNTTAECTEYFRKNTAFIEIYYEQLNFERLKETQAYTIINLLADFGGNIGLWIGFSVITFIELIELAMELFYLCYFRRSRSEQKKKRSMMHGRMKNHMQHFSAEDLPGSPLQSNRLADRYADMAALAKAFHRESLAENPPQNTHSQLAPTSSIYRTEDPRDHSIKRTVSDPRERDRMLHIVDSYDDDGFEFDENLE